jgi:hypothetical protein
LVAFLGLGAALGLAGPFAAGAFCGTVKSGRLRRVSKRYVDGYSSPWLSAQQQLLQVSLWSQPSSLGPRRSHSHRSPYENHFARSWTWLRMREGWVGFDSTSD